MFETVATGLFAAAILHTFSVKQLQKVAGRFEDGSLGENVFHLLGEVEVVFGVWAAIFLIFLSLTSGFDSAASFVESISFAEPVFVFAVMFVAATRPVLFSAEWVMRAIARLIPLSPEISYFLSVVIFGPLLGSLITEPAAMTVSALLLRDTFFSDRASSKFRYALLGLLFVNVSIGGTLTHFAAPPVVMVAHTWGWTTPFMFETFGWRALSSVILSSLVIAGVFQREIKSQKLSHSSKQGSPAWLIAVHFLFLAGIVFASHHPIIVVGAVLFFIAVATATKEHQDELRFRSSLLVGLFLAGLVVLGNPQRWWLEPLLVGRNEGQLYFGATLLTAVLDNAAITYLGSLVPDLTQIAKYALVAGSVTGGGLTIIANAPNPAGYSILNEKFGTDGISPLGLLVGALLPTLIAVVFFWLI